MNSSPRNAPTPSPARFALFHAQQAFAAGRRADALEFVRQAVAADPYHSESLLWLAALCGDPHESLRYLTRALALDPQNRAALDGVRWARQQLAERSAPAIVAPTTEPPRAPSAIRVPPTAHRIAARLIRRVVAIGVALGFLLLIAVSARSMWREQYATDAESASRVALVDDAAVVPTLPAVVADAPSEPTAPLNTGSMSAMQADQTLRELDVVWAQHDWARAAPLVAQAMASRPNDPSLRQKLMAAYFNRAVNLLDEGKLDAALRAFDDALAVIPGEPQAQAKRNTLANYLAGLQQFQQSHWAAAAQALAKVHAADAGYRDTRELLYRAYYQHGLELKSKNDIDGAQRAFQAAVNVDNSASEARSELAQAKTALAAPLPQPVGAKGAKWIDVNLTTQRFRAYQGQTLVYSFVTSTGAPGRATQPGRYQVLDKIPYAYSRFWQLWMPYWMGIYWAGASENGIHALPILRSGQTLWAGSLGRRVSFGCVILNTNASKTIYHWAEIGTPVIIHY